MAIEKPSFSTRSLEYQPETVIQLVPMRPRTKTLLDPAVEPNRLVGYYDISSGTVELFVSAPFD